MKHADIIALCTGDTISCKECPDHGCTGEPALVEVRRSKHQDVYYHGGNEFYFLRIVYDCTYSSERIDWNVGVTGYTMKLLKKVNPSTVKGGAA